MDPLINVKSVTRSLIQKENLKSMSNMLNIEGKVVVGNNDAKNIKEKMITPRLNSTWNISV